MSWEERRARVRASLEAAVTLQFESASQPVSGFTGDVSEGGMFVRTESPKPVGTLVRFELDFGGAGGLVRSIGEVAWIRVRGDGAERPPGMGIRFRYLDPESLETVRGRVAAFLAENPPPAPSAPAESAPAEEIPLAKRPAAPPASPPTPEADERARRGQFAPRGRPHREGPGMKPPETKGVPRSRWILLAILGLLILVWLLF